MIRLWSICGRVYPPNMQGSRARWWCFSWSRAEEGAGFALDEPVGRNENSGMIVEKIPALKALSVEEKLTLVRELWEELAAHPDAFPPREDHIKLLQERLEH